MKNLKKNLLKFDREVISSLSENDLSVVKGGAFAYTEPATRCLDAETRCMVIAYTKVKCPETEGFCPIPDTQICKSVGFTCVIPDVHYTDQVNCPTK